MSDKDFGFFRVSAASIPVYLGKPVANAVEIIGRIDDAERENVGLIVFPELAITGYTCADLFSKGEFIREALEGVRLVKEATLNHHVLVCVGAPIAYKNKLYNCAVYMQNGKILGIVPKTYVPNYGEFYEKRWFVSGNNKDTDYIDILGENVPFSENLLLRGDNDAVIGTEICEDLWVSNPPSGKLSAMGANIIVNPSASNEVIGKREYRRNLVSMQSARCRSAYVYASSGVGESSTDLVFSGHVIISEDGRINKEGFDEVITSVIDIEKANNDKRKYNSEAWISEYNKCIEVPFTTGRNKDIRPDYVNPYPFVPKDKDELHNRSIEILNLQARGLIMRLKATKINDVVVGISGGLDSTLALLVCVEAFTKLNIPLSNIHCVTMPGFGTSKKTLGISRKLIKSLGCDFKEIDITKSAKLHLKELGHEEGVYDIAYENAQARERTQILFDYANMVGGLVIGTGDMSELALGWCTYNGDHISNYGVNVSVPKTLVKYIVLNYANRTDKEISDDVRKVLSDICGLPISPELLPPDANGEIAQKTEDTIGKYDLHDFFLYHFMRNGFGKDKIRLLAGIAFENVDEKEIDKTLDTFYHRFRTQQFKRSCIPDGVKVGTVSLSPRGDLRLPSDLMMLY